MEVSFAAPGAAIRAIAIFMRVSKADAVYHLAQRLDRTTPQHRLMPRPLARDTPFGGGATSVIGARTCGCRR